MKPYSSFKNVLLMVKYSIDSMSYILSKTLINYFLILNTSIITISNYEVYRCFWSKINFHQTSLLGLGRVTFLHVINVSVTDVNLVP